MTKTRPPLDPAFFAVTITGNDGCYAFMTVRPSAYPAAPGRGRPTQIHFSVTGKTEQAFTPICFKGEAWNERHPWLMSAGRKDAPIADPRPLRDENRAPWRCHLISS